MKTLLCLFAAVAFAQDPAADLAPATPGDLVADAPTTTTMWATTDTRLLRTPADDAVAVGDLASGDKVQLVLADGDHYRVLKGTIVGWVPATAVSQLPPTPAASGLGLGLPGGIQLGGATPLTTGK